MEHEPSVQNHYDHASKCKQSANNLILDKLLLVEDAEENGGKKWTTANDERCVRRGCVLQRHVLSEEICTSSGESQGSSDEFVFHIVAPQLLVIEGYEQQISQQKAHEEYCRRCEVVSEEYLRRHECGTPNDDCQYCKDMVCQQFVTHKRCKITVFFLPSVLFCPLFYESKQKCPIRYYILMCRALLQILQIWYRKRMCVRTQRLIIVKNSTFFRLLLAEKFASFRKPPTFAPAKHENSNVQVLAINPNGVKRFG